MTFSDVVPVVFIAGASRSGSTVVGQVLGSSLRAVHVGELTFLWERGFRDNELCGCAVPLRHCTFWRAVATDAFGGPLEPDALHRVIALRHEVDDMPSVHRFFRPETPAMREYAGTLARILWSVARVANADVVIDSSKRPTHGLALSLSSELRVDWVHLVRDSRAVAFSETRRRQRPEVHTRTELMPRVAPAKNSLRWNVQNLLAETGRWKADTYSLLRYEDFAASPTGALSSILERHDLGGSALVGKTLKVSDEHTVSGNPMRFSTGELQIRPDDEWRSGLRARDRRAVTPLSAPLLRRYGYATC